MDCYTDDHSHVIYQKKASAPEEFALELPAAYKVKPLGTWASFMHKFTVSSDAVSQNKKVFLCPTSVICVITKCLVRALSKTYPNILLAVGQSSVNITLALRVIYSLTTDRQPVIYWTTNHLLARLYFYSNTQKRRKSKCSLQMLPVFHQYMKRNPAKTLTVT